MDRRENIVLSVAVELLCLCLLAEPLPINGRCIVAYLMVVAYQRVHIPHYFPR
jgi:hypothetical protein